MTAWEPFDLAGRWEVAVAEDPDADATWTGRAPSVRPEWEVLAARLIDRAPVAQKSP